jgi:hypothetical protein
MLLVDAYTRCPGEIVQTAWHWTNDICGSSPNYDISAGTGDVLPRLAGYPDAGAALSDMIANAARCYSGPDVTFVSADPPDTTGNASYSHGLCMGSWGSTTNPPQEIQRDMYTVTYHLLVKSAQPGV